MLAHGAVLLSIPGFGNGVNSALLLVSHEEKKLCASGHVKGQDLELQINNLRPHLYHSSTHILVPVLFLMTWMPNGLELISTL